MRNVICYANLNSFNSPDNISDEHMKAFFNAYLNNSEISIIDVVIDRCSPNIFYAHRDGWKKIALLCTKETVDMIVVPTAQMLSTPIFDVIKTNVEIKEHYGCDICYLYENMCTMDESYNLQLQYFSLVESEIKQHKKIATKMRSTFVEATGINDKNSAIPVYIDAPQYRKVEQFARTYGANVDQILKCFLDAIVEPKNYEKLDELLGF